jgi:hypothetical protein
LAGGDVGAVAGSVVIVDVKDAEDTERRRRKKRWDCNIWEE